LNFAKLDFLKKKLRKIFNPPGQPSVHLFDSQLKKSAFANFALPEADGPCKNLTFSACGAYILTLQEKEDEVEEEREIEVLTVKEKIREKMMSMIGGKGDTVTIKEGGKESTGKDSGTSKSVEGMEIEGESNAMDVDETKSTSPSSPTITATKSKEFQITQKKKIKLSRKTKIQKLRLLDAYDGKQLCEYEIPASLTRCMHQKFPIEDFLAKTKLGDDDPARSNAKNLAASGIADVAGIGAMIGDILREEDNEGNGKSDGGAKGEGLGKQTGGVNVGATTGDVEMEDGKQDSTKEGPPKLRPEMTAFCDYPACLFSENTSTTSATTPPPNKSDNTNPSNTNPNINPSNTTPSAHLLTRLSQIHPNSISFSPCANFVSVSLPGFIHIFDRKAGKQPVRIIPTFGEVTRHCWSPGRRMLMVSVKDEVQWWI
jgi:hypothetical protein